MGRLPLAVMFSGHGTQYPKMGLPFYEKFPSFRQIIDQADEICRPLLSGVSLREEIYRDRPNKIFDQTLFTHPGLFATQWATYQLLLEQGFVAEAFIGSSLGELTTFAAAGAFDFESMLKRCCREALKMEEVCPPGGMTAILSDHQLFFQDPEIHSNVDLAGVNLPKNFIVSGSFLALERAEKHLANRGIFFQRLPVRTPFHSRLMEPFLEPAKSIFAAAEIGPLTQPVYSCVSPGRVSAVTIEHVWKLIRQPIELLKGVTTMEQEGPWYYVDCGPSGTLATALKYILPGAEKGGPSNKGSRFSATLSQFGKPIEQLNQLVKSLQENAEDR
jgi:acyl transferase domain-containing protein